MEALSWEVISCATYSLELASCDYHLFASKNHALAEQRFGLYEDKKKWLDEWFAAEEKDFTDVVLTNCPKNRKNVKQAMEHTFTKALLIIFPNLTRFFKKINPYFILIR